MAEISNCESDAGFRQRLRALSDAELTAQDLVQQGAINAVSTLVAWGCSTSTADEMLASLRRCAQLIRNEEQHRGRKVLFAADQVASISATHEGH